MWQGPSLSGQRREVCKGRWRCCIVGWADTRRLWVCSKWIDRERWHGGPSSFWSSPAGGLSLLERSHRKAWATIGSALELLSLLPNAEGGSSHNASYDDERYP